MQKYETKEYYYQIDPVDNQLYLFLGPNLPNNCGKCLVTILEEETIPQHDDEMYDIKDIYLKNNNGQIIGLHAIGHNEPASYTIVNINGTENLIRSRFNPIECWGNEYNNKLEMVGKGSFRLSTFDIEQEAIDFEKEGWIRFIPKDKDNA